jgi:hypothetical protein
MQIQNRSSHPTREVERIVRRGYGAGPTPRRVIIHERVSRSDNREGWTPFDSSQPSELWIEPSSRYPEPGNARTWQQELFESAAHEAAHFRNPEASDATAERAAHARYRAAGSFRRRGLELRPAWCGRPR